MDKYNYIMDVLVSEFKLTSAQQERFRKLLRGLEDEAFANGKHFAERSLPEPRRQFKDSKNDVSDVQSEQRMQEMNWQNEAQKAQDWLEEQRNS